MNLLFNESWCWSLHRVSQR